MNRKGLFRRGFAAVMAVTMGITTLPGGIGNAADTVMAATTVDAAQVLSMSFEDNLTDASGKGNNGTAVGTVGYGEGVHGKALHLAGTGYVNMGSSTDLQPSELSVSFWLKAPSAGLSGEQMIIWNKGDGQYASDGWYMGSASDTRPVEVSLGKDSTQPYKIFVAGNRSEFFPAGEWVHVVVAYNSQTKEAAIYRNGVPQTVSTEYDSAEGVVRGTSDVKWLGTNSPVYGAKSSFDIDELKIYTACVTGEDAVALY